MRAAYCPIPGMGACSCCYGWAPWDVLTRVREEGERSGVTRFYCPACIELVESLEIPIKEEKYEGNS